MLKFSPFLASILKPKITFTEYFESPKSNKITFINTEQKEKHTLSTGTHLRTAELYLKERRCPVYFK